MKMSEKSTAKAMFASLCANYEGSKKVREAKARMLVHQYELFKMKDDESIEQMYSRFQTLVFGLQILKKSYVTSYHASKILRSLHARYLLGRVIFQMNLIWLIFLAISYPWILLIVYVTFLSINFSFVGLLLSLLLITNIEYCLLRGRTVFQREKIYSFYINSATLLLWKIQRKHIPFFFSSFNFTEKPSAWVTMSIIFLVSW